MRTRTSAGRACAVSGLQSLSRLIELVSLESYAVCRLDYSSLPDVTSMDLLQVWTTELPCFEDSSHMHVWERGSVGVWDYLRKHDVMITNNKN